jgi:hypothetical protein
VEGMLAEFLDVGDAFECLHGFLLLMGTKKPAGGRALGGYKIELFNRMA